MLVDFVYGLALSSRPFFYFLFGFILRLYSGMLDEKRILLFE